ncbi:putative concanavalin A-like lectin/glucanase domain, legume lectin [Medicago truncatula]|uniref:Legume lectin beta domain protein n=1 Tax=Medicago truncatula TaxID=3880 RepID=G7IXH3_MEDTR|nr:putative bark agglutinin LECRPA3 [Medicago truncatula]AES70059.2 legume lectin beta domain protein [Medicago truncatula]RHN66846.1 putative concanavalin A-like lectin/glucanase domain, legume lectin [Medicago truncatula]
MAFFPHNQKLFSFVLVIFTISFLLLATELVNSDKTVSFDLTDYTSGEQNLTLQGNAIIHDTHLELTSIEDDPYANVGRALYPTPVPIWDKTTGNVASFVTSFSFSLARFGSYPPADGLIFFLAPPNSVIPNSSIHGGDLGVIDDTTAFNRFVGVEFDNFVNEWDPNHSHIGIDVNSLISSKIGSWKSETGVLYNVRIIYDSLSKTLSVSLTDENGQVSTVAQVVDLKDVLPETVSIGLSASTSANLRQKHVIKTWSFNSILKTTISSNILENTNHTAIRMS